MTPKSSKTVVGYARVSTAQQADEGVSLEAQRRAIEARAAEIGATNVAYYEDAGISGTRIETRPGLQKALDHVCRCGGILIVHSLSRLARSTVDAISTSERLRKCGADLVSISELIDTTSAAGKMVFQMLAVLAEFERNVISERTRTALAHKRAQGLRISGRVPFGFDLNESDGRSLIENPVEQTAIRRLVALRAGGASYRQIAADLEASGVRTKLGRPWQPETVRQLCKKHPAS